MKILINFYAQVSENSVNNLINFITQQLALQKKENPIDEIIIQISSSGGSSDYGLLAYNYLRQLNISKTTIGMGNVDSAAVMIFCAGDKRLAMPSCRFTLHEALTTIQGTFNGTKLHEFANLNERITQDYCNIIAKITDYSLEEIENKVKKGKVMSSSEAKEFRLIDNAQINPYISEMKDISVFMINNSPPPQFQKLNRNNDVKN